MAESNSTLLTVSEDGGAIAQTCERIFETHCAPEQLLDAEGGWSPDLWNELSEAGVVAALQPTGGPLGIAPPDALNVIALSGRFAAPVPLAETMLANWLALSAGMDEQTGSATLAGTDRRDSIRIEPSGNGFRLHGRAAAVPWARSCAWILVVVPGGEGLRLARVPAEAISVTKGESIAREPRDDIAIDATLDKASIVELDRPLQFVRALGASIRVLQMAGALDELLGMTIRYASTRVQFARAISKFQAVQQNIAVLGGQIAAARAAANGVARTFGDAAAYYAVAAAKVRLSEAVGLSTRIAHQVHGAIGITQEYGLHFLTKRLWSWRDEFGSDAEWSRILGREILGLGSGGLWPALTDGLVLPGSTGGPFSTQTTIAAE